MEHIKCEHYKKCGGCQLQNLSYDKQLKYKQIKVIKLLGKLCRVNEIIGMDKPYHYRNKVQAAFRQKNGKIFSGVYQSTTKNIIPVDYCLIEDQKADEIIITIRKLLKSFKLKPFDNETSSGFLRHVLVKRSFKTNQIMVVLVTATDKFPNQSKFVNAILSRHPEVTTVVQNINDKKIFLALGEESRVLYGNGYIEDELLGKKFRISPKAFYQVNPTQTEKLYTKTLEFADIKNSETVIDAYCGTGTIGILASERAKRVIGVELNNDAVLDAKTNASLNNIENIEFFNADAGKFMIKMAAEKTKADLVIMDPPRAGASMEFLRSLVALSPEKIVYISCNPETQARDLKYLISKKYRVKKIQPVDMFPHTNHVETICLICKQTTK